MKKILISVRTILEKVDENRAHLVRLEVGKHMQAQWSTQNFEYFIKPATSGDELKGIEEKLQEEGAKEAAAGVRLPDPLIFKQACNRLHIFQLTKFQIDFLCSFSFTGKILLQLESVRI